MHFASHMRPSDTKTASKASQGNVGSGLELGVQHFEVLVSLHFSQSASGSMCARVRRINNGLFGSIIGACHRFMTCQYQHVLVVTCIAIVTLGSGWYFGASPFWLFLRLLLFAVACGRGGVFAVAEFFPAGLRERDVLLVVPGGFAKHPPAATAQKARLLQQQNPPTLTHPRSNSRQKLFPAPTAKKHQPQKNANCGYWGLLLVCCGCREGLVLLFGPGRAIPSLAGLPGLHLHSRTANKHQHPNNKNVPSALISLQRNAHHVNDCCCQVMSLLSSAYLTAKHNLPVPALCRTQQAASLISPPNKPRRPKTI